MAQFTVIDGGGPPDHEAARARYALRMMIVEVLRALARGDDVDRRIVRHLVEFTEHASGMKAPISSVIADVISEMGKNLVRTGIGDDFQAEIDNIVSSALSVAAEVCADDGLAKARASKRMDRLRKGLEDHVIGRETRARANGRSYLLPLLEREFPTERKKRPKKARPPGPPSGP